MFEIVWKSSLKPEYLKQLDTNTIITGKSLFICDRFIKDAFTSDKRVIKQFHSIQYLNSGNLYDILLTPFINTEDSQNFILLLEYLVSHKNVTEEKTIICIHVRGRMSDRILYAYKTIIDKYSVNATFYILSTHLSWIPSIILSRFIIIRAIADNHKTVSKLLQIHYPELDTLEERTKMLEYVDGNLDACDFLIKEGKRPLVYKSKLDTFLYEFIVNRKFKIHDGCIKLSASGISVAEICKGILRIVNKEPGAKLIALLAEFDQKSSVVNKEIFALEYYIQQIILEISSIIS